MPDISPKKPPKRKPPAKAPKSRQYDLFTQFFGKPQDLSNTVELWDAIPKYAVTARRQVSLRDDKGRLPVHEYRFEYAGRPCRLEVQPASIKVGDRFQDFYPSADEELVEEVLRKIFADQAYGIHVVEDAESWVRFSLYMIRTELAARGKTRSLDEIKRSIDILSNTIVRFYAEGEADAIYTEPVLGTLIKGRRATGDDDGGSTLWAARLPVLVSKSINELTYRQFNYGTLMALSSQLARWLHKPRAAEDRACAAIPNWVAQSRLDETSTTPTAAGHIVQRPSHTKARRPEEHLVGGEGLTHFLAFVPSCETNGRQRPLARVPRLLSVRRGPARGA